MKFGFGMTAVVALLVVFFTIPVTAAEILTLKATDGRFKIQGGFYPNYLVFLKGLDPSTIKTAWVDKEYYAVLDVHEGPEAGQSAIMTLKKSSDRSPQPEWCKTEGGENFEGERNYLPEKFRRFYRTTSLQGKSQMAGFCCRTTGGVAGSNMGRIS